MKIYKTSGEMQSQINRGLSQLQISVQLHFLTMNAHYTSNLLPHSPPDLAPRTSPAQPIFVRRTWK